jgi:hypothetical protein
MHTHIEAYESIKPKMRSLQKIVFDAVRLSGSAGMTASEVIAATGLLDYTARPRLTELFQDGKLIKAGRRKNERGNSETIYIAA